uniref:Ig-like domain-containing protein n=1 Tax=Fundulus heteroclitus TaxID=8078 RepID=A0A3Q2QX88_FUNHE
FFYVIDSVLGLGSVLVLVNGIVWVLMRFDFVLCFLSEGSSVALSCNFTKGEADYFFWYRQNPGKRLEFLIFNTGYEEPQKDSLSKLSGRVRKTEAQMDLLISSAAVSDSAVYYCALQPTVTGNSRTLYKNLQYSTTSTRGPHRLLHLWFVRIQSD